MEKGKTFRLSPYCHQWLCLISINRPSPVPEDTAIARKAAARPAPASLRLAPTQ